MTESAKAERSNRQGDREVMIDHPSAAAEIVSILAIYREEAVARLTKLAKRAARYGQAITWTETPVTIERQGRRWDGKPMTIVEERVELAIVGTAPRAGDFRFLAALESVPGGTLISGVPGVEIGKLGSDWDGRCEHCGANRARRVAYVVEDEAGARKVVGKSCLRDHLGMDSPAGIVGLFKYYQEALAGEGEDGESWGRSGRWQDSTIGIIAASRAAIAIWGWVPASAEGYSTRYRVGQLNAKIDSRNRDAIEDQRKLVAELAERGDHYHETALQVLEWGRALDGRSDYERNLKVALAGETVVDKTLGLVVSAAAAFDRQVTVEEKRRAERAAQPASFHVGEVGERLKDIEITVERLVGLPDYGWGPSTLFIMRSEQGALISWKTQGDAWIGDRRAEVGMQAKASFRVKSHNDYQGTPETRVSRATFKAIEAAK